MLPAHRDPFVVVVNLQTTNGCRYSLATATDGDRRRPAATVRTLDDDHDHDHDET
jgi:hypothetical protein